MSSASTTQPVRRKHRHKDPWDWFFEMTFGVVLRFITWLTCAIFIAVLIEWGGMMYWWGPGHSQEVLEKEISFLGSFNQNLLTGLYPSDIASVMVNWVDKWITFFQLREISASLAKGAHNSVTVFARYGVEAFINTLFIFAVRLAVCISAMTGFALVCMVAFIDGLVERDIRRACGGIESAMIYITSPFSIHPTLIFLPIMAIVGVSIFFATKYFKKY
jgi:integrating conjugative element membrane protein (TIGR03747 family)